MSSAEIKEEISQFFAGSKIGRTENRDWKMVSKKSLWGGEAQIRTFRNPIIGLEVHTLDDYGEISIIESGTMLFDVGQADPEEMGMEGVFVMFAPESFWKREHCIPDSHLLWAMENCYGVKEGLLDELAENQFLVTDMTLEEVKTYLTSLGMRHEDMSTAGQ